MMYSKPIHISMLATIEDYINETKYETIDDILKFILKFETNIEICLGDIQYIKKALEDKSFNFTLTSTGFSKLHILDNFYPHQEDHIVGMDPKVNSDLLICKRHDGVEKVYHELIQYDEYFEDTDEFGNPTYSVYYNTGLKIVKSKLTNSIQESNRRSKKAVEKYKF